MATILVVDDQPVNREFLVTLLSYGGHRLLEASDGREGLVRAAAEKPDLIITDLLMPTMDGFEFVRQLRADPALAETAVVFYTATYLETEARSLAEACGVPHVLTKPAEPEVVLRVVNEALGKAGAPAVAEIPQEAFRDEHLRLLTDTLARKAEIVVPRLNAIIDLSLQLSSERAPSQLLETFCAAARKILGAKYSLLGLLNRDGRSPGDRRLFWHGFEPPAEALPPFWPLQGMIGQAVAEGRTLRTQGAALRPAEMGLPPWYPPASSFLIAPIASPAHRYGWVCLAEKVASSGFSDEEEHLASILAALLGRIYENGYFYAEARQHAQDLEREVVERNRVEGALRLSEARFRQMAERIPEVFWVLDPAGPHMEYISPAYETVWGRTRTSLYENPVAWMDDVLLEDRPSAIAHFKLSSEGKETDHEYRIRRPDGTIRLIWNRAFPIRSGAAEGVERIIGIAVDLTDRKHLEQQLRQSQRMEAVGRLAGGVAHDFNNLLGVIIGYGEGSLRALPAEHVVRPKIDQILRAGERAAGLTRQLLTFSRKQVISPTVLDLNVVVKDIQKMLRTLIGEDIDLRVSLAEDLGRIKADAGEVEQVIMNLAVNARDAMPKGGRLTIETANVSLDEVYEREHGGPAPGRYVLMAVTDTGLGMSPEIQAQIFEPFFTTKEVGKGTGLGLSTVYGIVKQSGGHVAVYSEPDHGACFKVYVPRVDQAPDVLEPQVPVSIPQGTETILLVEDEESLRAMTQELLEERGYSVLTAANGVEALRVARVHPGEIHLLITDVIMPGIGGRDLAAQLARERPDTKVLYMSGYTDDAIVHHGVLSADLSFLQKPFTSERLARKVREALERGNHRQA
jgi:PAS domain S-box-containing protein